MRLLAALLLLLAAGASAATWRGTLTIDEHPDQPCRVRVKARFTPDRTELVGHMWIRPPRGARCDMESFSRVPDFYLAIGDFLSFGTLRLKWGSLHQPSSWGQVDCDLVGVVDSSRVWAMVLEYGCGPSGLHGVLDLARTT